MPFTTCCKPTCSSDLAKVKGIGHKQDGVPVLNPPERVVPQERMDARPARLRLGPAPVSPAPARPVPRPFLARRIQPQPPHPLRRHLHLAGLQVQMRLLHGQHRQPRGQCRRRGRLPFPQHALLVAGLHHRRIREARPARRRDACASRTRCSSSTRSSSSRCSTSSSSAASSSACGLTPAIDTVQPHYLDLFRRAGIGALALGVEAGNQMIRHEVSKGSFKDVNIRQVVRTIRDHGLNINANYIFGFPDDTLETMQQTLDLALELNTEMANMYPCQALPGSTLYYLARTNGWRPAGLLRRLRLPLLRKPAPAHPPLLRRRGPALPRRRLAEILHQPRLPRPRRAQVRPRAAAQRPGHGQPSSSAANCWAIPRPRTLPSRNSPNNPSSCQPQNSAADSCTAENGPKLGGVARTRRGVEAGCSAHAFDRFPPPSGGHSCRPRLLVLTP